MTKAKLLPKPFEQIGKYLKRSAWVSVLESLILIMIGILLVSTPNTSAMVITYIAAIFFIVRGLYQVINYFLSKGYRNFFDNNLLWGIISIVVGLALLLAGEKVTDLLRIIIGIWIIYSSIVHISTAVKLSAAQVKNWFIILIMALITLVLGGIIVAYQNSAIILAGWLLIFSGISGVISDIIFISNIEDIAKTLKTNN